MLNSSSGNVGAIVTAGGIRNEARLLRAGSCGPKY